MDAVKLRSFLPLIMLKRIFVASTGVAERVSGSDREGCSFEGIFGRGAACLCEAGSIYLHHLVFF
jgi:hypothetical protein